MGCISSFHTLELSPWGLYDVLTGQDSCSRRPGGLWGMHPDNPFNLLEPALATAVEVHPNAQGFPLA